MLEFKVIANLKSNKDLTDILKDFKYKVMCQWGRSFLTIFYVVKIPRPHWHHWHMKF